MWSEVLRFALGAKPRSKDAGSDYRNNRVMPPPRNEPVDAQPQQAHRKDKIPDRPMVPLDSNQTAQPGRDADVDGRPAVVPRIAARAKKSPGTRPGLVGDATCRCEISRPCG
jgi:hypothetical protein